MGKNTLWSWCPTCGTTQDHRWIYLTSLDDKKGWFCRGCRHINKSLNNREKEKKVSTFNEAESLIELHGNGITEDMSTADIFAYYSQFCEESEIVDAAVFITDRGMYDDPS